MWFHFSTSTLTCLPWSTTAACTMITTEMERIPWSEAVKSSSGTWPTTLTSALDTRTMFWPSVMTWTTEELGNSASESREFVFQLDTILAWLQRLVRVIKSLTWKCHCYHSIFSGDLSDNHDVISFKTYQLDATDAQMQEDRSQIAPSSSYFESPRDHVDDPKPSSMSGLKIFFLLLLGVLGCIACAVIGIMIYQKQQDNSRKRFYWCWLSHSSGLEPN